MTTNTTDPTATDDQGTPDVDDHTLESLPADRLAAMLRDKRKAEATLRTRLRDTETERDGLRGTVDGFQRSALLEAAKGRGLLDTAQDDLAAAVQLADVLGDDGLLDAAKASDALDALRTSKPHWFKAPPASSSADHSGGSGESTAPPAASWHDVITGA